jgi:hypothetical protein
MKIEETTAIMLANLIFDWVRDPNQKELTIRVNDEPFFLKKNKEKLIILDQDKKNQEYVQLKMVPEDLLSEKYLIDISLGDSNDPPKVVVKDKSCYRYMRTPEEITVFH